MWICKNCENQNEENFKFCWSCGESKSASRKTVRGNTTELSFPKKSAEKEIPQVKKIKVETKKSVEESIKPPNKKVEPKKSIEKKPEKKNSEKSSEKKKPVDVKVKTKEVPEFESEISEVTTQKAPDKQKKEKPASEKSVVEKETKSYEPEIFSSFSPESSETEKTEVKEAKTNWQKEIFTIAVRLLGLYFLYQFIAAIPEIANFVYLSFTANIEPDQFFLTFLLSIVTSLLKYFFYLFVGIYLIANGKILLRLLPEY